MKRKLMLIFLITLIAPLGIMGSSAAPAISDLVESDFIVRLHPENELYVGDLVSFEVIATDEEIDLEGKHVSIRVVEGDIDLGSAGFHPFGIGGRYQATMWWVWDTSASEPGNYTLEFNIDDELIWEQAINLQHALDRDALELTTSLALAETECCEIYYYETSAAWLDLETIIAEANTEAVAAISKMQVEFTEPITMLLMPRVLGHGGFAGGELYISYLDRNYAGDSLENVLHHEMIHELDRRAGGEFRPTMLVEGLAVYHSGGHFKKEPIYPRAAALIHLDWYIPLPTLAEGFYYQQHEITYLQAAALVEFMVERWGYEAFDAFYRDMTPPNDGKHGTAITGSLERNFDLTLSELDDLFYASLLEYHVPADMIDDMRITVEFFDSVRRYQLNLDTSAYFLTAWLPNLYGMLEEEFYSDLIRHPDELINLTIETMLISTEDNLVAGKYAEADRFIGEINTILGMIEDGEGIDWTAFELAGQYRAVLDLVLTEGYDPKRILLTEESAQVISVHPGRIPYERYLIDLEIQEEEWQVVAVTAQ